MLEVSSNAEGVVFCPLHLNILVRNEVLHRQLNFHP